MTEERFEVLKVDWQTFQVVDNKTRTEFCVCGGYDEQVEGPEARARTTAQALNLAELILKHMKGNT